MLLEDLTQLEDYVLKSRDRYIHTHIHPYTPIHIHTYTHIYVHTVTRHAFMHTHHACTHHLCRPIHKGWAEYTECPTYTRSPCTRHTPCGWIYTGGV